MASHLNVCILSPFHIAFSSCLEEIYSCLLEMMCVPPAVAMPLFL